MQKAKQRTKRMKLNIRIFRSCAILLVTALFVTCVLVMIPMLEVMQQNNAQTYTRDVQLVSNVIEGKLDTLNNYAISISTDSRVISTTAQYSGEELTETVKAGLRFSLGSWIQTILGANSDVFMYDVFTPIGEPFNIGGYDMTQLTDRLEHDFFEKASSELGTQIHGVYFFRHGNREVPVFVFSKLIVNLDTHEPYGILLLIVRESRFADVFSANSISPVMTFCLVNSEMRIMSCADKALLTAPVDQVFSLSEQEQALLNSRQSFVHRKGQRMYLLSPPVSKRTDWRLLSSARLYSVFDAYGDVIGYAAVIVSISCLLLLVIANQLARSVTKPLRELTSSVQSITKQDTLKRIPDPQGGMEIEILYRSFTQLLAHTHELMEEIKRQQEEKSNYKLQILQAQIKPHFLYNTLSTIKSLIDLGMGAEAAKGISAMASFYRLSLAKGNDVLSLKDEIELSNQYMCIQKLRYMDKLSYTFDIDKELYPFLLPKMTLQPLLENAIYHGIKEKHGMGQITVTGQKEGANMVIRVRDNGQGMDRETLLRLQNSLCAGRMIPGKLPSWGLFSVNRRIQLLFGLSYGISLDSRLNEYTIVTLTLPALCTLNGGEE